MRSCVQSIWIKHQLEDYSIHIDNIPLRRDSTSAINLTKNPIMHSRTKHIEIRHHFIRDHVAIEECKIEYIDTNNQLADIFTKSLARERFYVLRNELDILDFTCTA